jgi:hypothetical protein
MRIGEITKKQANLRQNSRYLSDTSTPKIFIYSHTSIESIHPIERKREMIPDVTRSHEHPQTKTRGKKARNNQINELQLPVRKFAACQEREGLEGVRDTEWRKVSKRAKTRKQRHRQRERKIR